jgi:hypothetical protein
MSDYGVRRGRSTITISARGCVDCGTEWATGWAEATAVECRIGRKEFLVPIPRCSDCDARLKAHAVDKLEHRREVRS